MSWQPWSFTDPFISYTPILAEEMNPKLNGISASFSYVANELNGYRPRLPENFAGNTSIPSGAYTNTLLGINAEGNMELIDKNEFQLASDKDFTIKKQSDQQISVDGNNHADWFVLNFESSVDDIIVIVGTATANINDAAAPAPGSTILFTQDTDAALTFAPIEGVTIKSPGLLKAYGQNSTVTLIAVDQYTWVLGGDVLPSEVIV